MSLIEALYESLAGGRSRPPAGATFGHLLGLLVQLAGSGAAAARRLGVSPTTLYRWRRGTQQPRTGASVIDRAIRRATLDPELERDIKAKTRTMRIHGTVTISKDTRARKLDVGRHIPKRKTQNIINAWLSGDDARTGRLLWAAIDKHYVDGIEIDDITAVTWE